METVKFIPHSMESKTIGYYYTNITDAFETGYFGEYGIPQFYFEHELRYSEEYDRYVWMFRNKGVESNCLWTDWR